jgi:hypothetical protein
MNNYPKLSMVEHFKNLPDSRLLNGIRWLAPIVRLRGRLDVSSDRTEILGEFRYSVRA